jgi:hypothetical protein
MQRVVHSPVATSGQRKQAKERLRKLEPALEAQKAVVATMATKFYTEEEAYGVPVTTEEVSKSMALAALETPEWLKDILRGLDVLIPEELLGLDITPTARVGGEKVGRVFYDDVWVEDGKIKVIRKGNLRVLGYTPQEAKKRFKTRRRRKRLTKRDIYIIEALKDGASPAAIALL